MELTEGGFRPFAGDFAAEQPPDIPDVLAHETAISWVKLRESKTKPARPWEESREAFTVRIRGIAQEVNAQWLTDERNVIVLWLEGRQTWCERAPLSPPRPLPLGTRRRVA